MGEYINKTTRYSIAPKGGSTLIKLKLVVNQEHLINQEKMVGVQPKDNRYSDM